MVALLSPMRCLRSVTAWTWALAWSWMAWCMQLPVTTLLFGLRVMEAAGDALALLLGRPNAKTQLAQHRAQILKHQQREAEQRRRLDTLGHEAADLRTDKLKWQQRSQELRQQLEQTQLKLEESTAAPAQAKPVNATARPAPRPGHSHMGPMHLAVAVTALAVHWWLLAEQDPLQRAMLHAVIWPGLWLYGAVMLRRVPTSLSHLVECSCYILLGYILHGMVELGVDNSHGTCSHDASADTVCLCGLQA